MAKFTPGIQRNIPIRLSNEVVHEASEAVLALVEWQPCDCGCPMQRSPANRRAVELMRIAAFIRTELLQDEEIQT